MLYYMRRLRSLLSVKGILIKMKLKSCGKVPVFGKNIRMGDLKYISVGDNFIIDEFAEVLCHSITSDTTPSLIIGHNVHISKHCCIGCSNKIVLEDDVRLAPYCHITDRNHQYEDIDTPIWRQPSNSPGAVVIGKQTWLGFSVQVMPGVVIGKHCVIAAGSIVTKNIPDYSVAAGNPAKVIKKYNFKALKWEKV